VCSSDLEEEIEDIESAIVPVPMPDKPKGTVKSIKWYLYDMWRIRRKNEYDARAQVVANSIPITSLPRYENMTDAGEIEGEISITEKLDGTSFTAYDYCNSTIFGKRIKGFHSKNRQRASPIYEQVYVEEHIEMKLEEIRKLLAEMKNTGSRNINVYIQGEIVTQSISAQYLKGAEKYALYIFNMCCDGEILPYHEMWWYCRTVGLNTVPFITSLTVSKGDNIEHILQKYRGGLSHLGSFDREGIVVKGEKGNNWIKFKYINPEYLLAKEARIQAKKKATIVPVSE
jgi:hypothetical protein